MVHVLSHAIGLAALGGVLGCSGRVLLALVGEVGRLRYLASFCLGLAWWTMALFALASAGWLNRVGLGAAALPLVAAAVALRRRIVPPRDPERPGEPWGRAETVFGIFLGGALFLFFLLAISPRIAWDADVYHLTLPRLYLENEGFRPVPMSVYSNWPLGTELLFSAAMLYGDYMSAKAVHFGFGLLVLYALYAGLPARKNSRLVAFLAGAFFLANDVVLFEFRHAYVDLAHAFFLLCGFLFLHHAREDEGARRDRLLLLAGISCGLAAGVKVTGILTAGMVGVLWVPVLLKRARLPTFLGRFALPVVLLWLPWLVKTALYTGNPFYPFGPGGADWSPLLSERFAAWQSSIGMGRTLADYLLLPVRVAFMGGPGYQHFDGEISPFWLVLVVLAVVFARRERLVRRALGVAGLWFVFWAFSSQQMRFLVPALPLVALAGAVSLTELLGRVRLAWRPWQVLAGAALLLATVQGPYLAGGFQTIFAFASHEGDLASTAVPERFRFVNEELPEEAKLLFVNTNLGFFCRREYLADSFFEASQIADWLRGVASADEVRERLAERGVTHVLADARPRVPDLPPALAALLNDQRLAQLVFRSSDGLFVVFELR